MISLIFDKVSRIAQTKDSLKLKKARFIYCTGSDVFGKGIKF